MRVVAAMPASLQEAFDEKESQEFVAAASVAGSSRDDYPSVIRPVLMFFLHARKQAEREAGSVLPVLPAHPAEGLAASQYGA